MTAHSGPKPCQLPRTVAAMMWGQRGVWQQGQSGWLAIILSLHWSMKCHCRIWCLLSWITKIVPQQISLIITYAWCRWIIYVLRNVNILVSWICNITLCFPVTPDTKSNVSFQKRIAGHYRKPILLWPLLLLTFIAYYFTSEGANVQQAHTMQHHLCPLKKHKLDIYIQSSSRNLGPVQS